VGLTIAAIAQMGVTKHRILPILSQVVVLLFIIIFNVQRSAHFDSGSITTHTKNEYSACTYTHSVVEAPDFPISTINSFKPCMEEISVKK